MEDLIYFEESDDGDTFIEKDPCADGYIARVIVKGRVVARITLSDVSDDAAYHEY